jgi:hypothetical protein
MIQVLVRKELRELLPITVVILLMQLYLVSTAMGVFLFLIRRSDETIPFVVDEMFWPMLVVAGLGAVGLGLWQTMRESGRGTFQFLLHRPARRDRIFATKLAVGCAVCLLLACLPVLSYAVWAAAPGTHASPFFWSMTGWVWQMCLEIPLVYLGAFLSGLRPGRWYGSRFLPLAASLMLLWGVHRLVPSSAAANLAAITIACACFWVTILRVSQSRDFS